MPNHTEIFVRFIDGVNVKIPVSANIVSENVFTLLPNQEFDYEDDSVLFEFGVGDLVKCEIHGKDENNNSCLLAIELIKSGSEKNDFKRLLFDILQNQPSREVIFVRYNKNIIEQLYHNNPYKYSDITKWIKQNKLYIKEFLQKNTG